MVTMIKVTIRLLEYLMCSVTTSPDFLSCSWFLIRGTRSKIFLKDTFTRTHGHDDYTCRSLAVYSGPSKGSHVHLSLLACVQLGQLMSNAKPSQALDLLPTTSLVRRVWAQGQDWDKVPDCHGHPCVYARAAGCRWAFCYPFKDKCVNRYRWLLGGEIKLVCVWSALRLRSVVDLIVRKQKRRSDYFLSQFWI